MAGGLVCGAVGTLESPAVTSSLERSFRITALAEATSFLALLVATYVKYRHDEPVGVEILGPIHGLLFIVYVVLALSLASRAGWGALTATGDASQAAFETRTGDSATPDASWSAFSPVGAGGAVSSPRGRYIQYQARLEAADPTVSPALAQVQIGFDVDDVGPRTVIDGVDVAGTTASVRFSSPDADVASFACGLDGGAVAINIEGETQTALLPFEWLVDAKLVITDALMKRGAEQRAARMTNNATDQED